MPSPRTQDQSRTSASGSPDYDVIVVDVDEPVEPQPDQKYIEDVQEYVDNEVKG